MNFLDQDTSHENTFKKTSPSSLTLSSSENRNTGKNHGDLEGQDRKLNNRFTEWLHQQTQAKLPLQIPNQGTSADHEHQLKDSNIQHGVNSHDNNIQKSDVQQICVSGINDCSLILIPI